MTLHVEVRGAGPDLVFVHGWGMNAGVWAPVVEELAGAYRLHLVELPGHGASVQAEGDGSLEDWAAAIRHAVPSGATWIGWSLGAQVAIRAALDDPARIAGLCLVAGTPRFVQAADWPHAMAGETFRQFSENLTEDHLGTLERFLALQVRGAERASETLRWLRREVRERPRPRDVGLDNGLRLLLETDLRRDLHRLSQPTLWLLGERDTLVPADVGGDLTALQPNADILVIGGAAHAPFLSHAARSTALLTRFLEEARAHA